MAVVILSVWLTAWWTGHADVDHECHFAPPDHEGWPSVRSTGWCGKFYRLQTPPAVNENTRVKQ